MLLDQKRTKRTVQIVAILTSIAFAGVIFVVLGLILFGGGGESAEDQLLSEAQARIETEPNNADAWVQLASAYRAKEEYPQAIDAAERALELAPDDFSRVQVLVQLQLDTNNADGAIDALQEYTARNPDNADAFLQLGQQAESAGREPLARLAYQAFLRIAPDDPNAEAVRERLQGLQSGGAAAPSG